MTDITELAQREKFEAWLEGAEALPLGYLKNRRASDSEYLDPSITDMWAAWKGASAELVEALEKAQRANAAQDDHINQQQDRIDQLEKGCRHAAKRINSWRRLAKRSIAEQEKCVDELDAARQRIVELDRKNSELDSLTQRWAVERAENAERIAELDAELEREREKSRRVMSRISELESRAVKLPKKNIGWDRDEEDCWNNAIDACAEVLAAAGIKVEAE
ncbi:MULTISPECIES: hypothetical protein [Klebsiella]|uniref:hypothetical protein n=1 Tax=Klebsiella TaxID=570 RepID=UPI000578D3F9|nr:MULTISPECIES: hypothetical protein [Klebsiella]AJA98140.1 hypothetical protein KR75_25760 [Klebsiella variicola]SBZ37130.1 chromosome segregation protein SMC [Klebsiella pneumoniae]SXD54496.1 chromosome segregation protein SMC [Klebsiella quasipneumoniae]